MQTNFTIDTTELMGSLIRIEAMLLTHYRLTLDADEFEIWYNMYQQQAKVLTDLAMPKKADNQQEGGM